MKLNLRESDKNNVYISYNVNKFEAHIKDEQIGGFFKMGAYSSVEALQSELAENGIVNAKWDYLSAHKRFEKARKEMAA